MGIFLRYASNQINSSKILNVVKLSFLDLLGSQFNEIIFIIEFNKQLLNVKREGF